MAILVPLLCSFLVIFFLLSCSSLASQQLQLIEQKGKSKGEIAETVLIPVSLSFICLIAYLSWMAVRALGPVGNFLVICFAFAALIHLVFFFNISRYLQLKNSHLLYILLLHSILISSMSTWSTKLSFFEDIQIRTGLFIPDNILPSEVGKMITENRDGDFFFGDWRTSDRPPLATGLIFLVRPIFFFLNYHERDFFILLGCQVLFLLSCWSLVNVLKSTLQHGRYLIMFILVFSLPIQINYVFTWPKLLAASCTIAAITLILSDRENELRVKILNRIELPLYIFSVTLLVFALLFHGAEFFHVLPVLMFLVVRQLKLQNLKRFALVVLTMVLIYAPWYTFQKWIVPSNDRLLKYHFAWQHARTDSAFIPTLINQFRNYGLEKWSQFRLENIQKIFGESLSGFITPVIPPININLVESKWNAGILFYSYSLVLPFMLVLSIRLFNYIKSQSTNVEYKFEIVFLSSLAATSVLVWVLMIFEPGSTITTHGSFSALIILKTAMLAYILESTHLKVPALFLLFLSSLSDIFVICQKRLVDTQSNFNIGPLILLCLLLIIAFRMMLKDSKLYKGSNKV